MNQDVEATEYRAINFAKIKNFRGFADVELDDIRRINILVGDNGAGKTAFLEALDFAASDSPEKIMKMRLHRSLPVGARGKRPFHDNVWEYFLRDFFHNFDLEKEIVLSIRGTDGYERTLEIFRDSKPTVLSLGNGKGAPQSLRSPISFKWTEGDRTEGSTVTPELNIDDENHRVMSFPSIAPSKIKGEFLERIVYPDPELFSELRIEGDSEPFLREIRKQFPSIEDISVESEFGNSSVFVKQESQPRRMPINLISDGFSKIVGLLLYFAARPRGLFFIDELDNGIFFRRHELFWRQIAEFSKRYEVQMFTSVHSREFLEAVLPVMRNSPENFSLTRIYREEGVSKAGLVSGSSVVNLIESGFEIRI